MLRRAGVSSMQCRLRNRGGLAPSRFWRAGRGFAEVALLVSLTLGLWPITGHSDSEGKALPASSEKVIFDDDDRRDIYEVSDADLLRLAEIVCLVVDRVQITDLENGTYFLTGAAPWLRFQGLPICQTERFIAQLQLGFCTGFLVGEDLVATAGHCVGPTDRSSSLCADVAFIFGFEQVGFGEPPQRLISEEQVYFCSEIVDHAFVLDRDHSVIRLDRPVAGRSPLPLRREGSVSQGDPLVLISHPGGLPKKVSDNATVRDPSPTSARFDTDADYLGGSSGGFVANLNDFTIEGILATGPALSDYVVVGDCAQIRRCPTAEGCPGFAGVTKSSEFSHAVPDILTSQGTVRSDRSRYNHQSTIHIEVRDKDVKGLGTLQIVADASEGDSELLNLVERPSGSGIFEGTVPTQPAGTTVTPGQIGDGVLQVRHGSEVTLTYFDDDHGTGVPMSVEKVVAIDSEPPVVTGLDITSVGGTFAVLNLTTDEPVRAIVSHTASGGAAGCPPFTPTYRDTTLSESFLITLKPLLPNQGYSFGIEVTDEAGNTTRADNGGACYSFTTTDRIDQLTEWFSNGDHDLAGASLLFTPDGSLSSYTVCLSSAEGYPTDPSGGEVLSLNDDDSREVILRGAAEVPFFGQDYKTVFVGSNGNLTFGSPDTAVFESLSEHFRVPRVSALFHDLVPEGNVSWKQTVDRVAITYDGIREFETDVRNDFQVELFFEGSIRLTYLETNTKNCLIGLSHGEGVLSDFRENNFTASQTCPDPPTATPTPTLTPTPTATPVPTWANERSDVSGDGRVDVFDLLTLLSDWKKVSGP